MKRTELKRRTPITRKRATKRRVNGETCEIRGCSRPARVNVYETREVAYDDIPAPGPIQVHVSRYCLADAKLEAGRLARQAVLLRDHHRCVACGTDQGVEWAHIIRRSQSDALHWDPENGLALCRTDHDRFDGSEILWRAWLDENRPGLWEALNVKRLEAIRAGDKPDYAEIIASLRSQAAGL